MPELPEVETIHLNIEPYLINERIISIKVRNCQLRWPISNKIYSLSNEIILDVQRRAKYILLKLQSGWIIIHLGMSGSLRIVTDEILPEKHDHVDLIISNNKILRYNDPRRFGFWLWTENIENHIMLKYLGPEPLSEKFNYNYLKTECKKKRTKIKYFLMNKRIVAGIGNIYANESLFAAKIHPERITNTLSQDESKLLVDSIKRILKQSIKKGGTTLKNFTKSNGDPGLFFKELLVYGRVGKQCKICNTPIMRTKHAQRATFYCVSCQK